MSEDKPEGLFRKITRRGFLGLLGVGAATVATGGVSVPVAAEKAQRFLEGSLNEEQKKYLEMFIKNDPRIQHELKITGKDGVLVRRLPNSNPILEPNNDSLETLPPGQEINDFIPLEGNDPNAPTVKTRKGICYAIPRKTSKGEIDSIGFIYSGNLENKNPS